MSWREYGDRHFPTGPLRVAVKKAATRSAISYRDSRVTGVADYCRRLGIPSKTLYRPTLTTYTIDRLCCLIGLHPIEVYPDFDKPSAEEEERWAA